MVGIKVSASAIYSEATATRFVEDAIFLYKQAIIATDELERKRFSRLAIMVIPFYLESISNYLFDNFLNSKKLDDVDNRNELQKPVRRFRAVYNKCLNKELKDRDINGIRDIFTIRNKITAHPKGRSSLVTTKNGWEREDENISYHKLEGLPKVYSHFFPEHSYLIFTEVHDFLTKYITSIKHKLTEEQYNYIWPKNLIDWKSTQTSPPPTLTPSPLSPSP
jgi:hypothetical protein